MAIEPQDRTPEQVEADNVAFAREIRAQLAADPRRGKWGGTEEITEELLTESAAASGRAS
jgi:hypothetical protein